MKLVRISLITVIVLWAMILQAAPQRLVGYLPYYRQLDSDQCKTLSHVILFNVVPNGATGLIEIHSTDPVTGVITYKNSVGGAGLKSSQIEETIQQAKEYGTRVGICIGGGGVHLPFRNLVMNGKTLVFADCVRDFVVHYGLDEVNIDWEHPELDWDATRAELIFQKLHERLDPIGVDLTGAWPADTSKTYAMKAARLCRQYSDAAYLMSYKYNYVSFRDRFLLYTKLVVNGGQGYAAAKVCPGVQFFGRDLAKTLTKNYSAIVDLSGGTIDPADNSIVVSGKTLWYMGQNMFQTICNYSAINDCGVMIWEIGQDKTPEHESSLMSVMHNRLSVDSATGTPHWWLRTHGILDDYAVVASEDLDFDGTQTWEEYIANTHPTNSSSVFRLFDKDEWFSYRAESNRLYTIQYTTNLASGIWAILGTNDTVGYGQVVDLPLETNSPACYYRINVKLGN